MTAPFSQMAATAPHSVSNSTIRLTMQSETHEEACDRYAGVPELDWAKFCEGEIVRQYPRKLSKGSLDKMRAEGQRRVKERTKASKSEAAQKPRLTEAETAELIRDIEKIADLDGLVLNLRADEIASRYGISVVDIKAEIRSIHRRRAEQARESSGGAGLEVLFDDPESWESEVDGAALLAEIAAAIKEHMDLPPHVAELGALWIMHTYCYRIFSHSIRLAIMSPQPRCGKTRLQDLIGLMAWRAMQAANISPAAMFRLVSHYGVTLIIDEVDTFLTGPNASEEARGILNAGHGRNGQVLRCEGDDNKVVAFPCFGPVVLGGIGTLPATLADRSALAWLQRKSKDKKLPRIDDRHESWARIKRQCRRWADENYDALASAEPETPDDLTDRQADGWRALLAIAAVAGGDWPEIARSASIAISGAEPESETIEVQLLTDIFAMFHENRGTEDSPQWEPRKEAMASKTIVEGLLKLETRPWPEWKGKGLTPTALSYQLSKFRIRSRQLKGKPGIDGNPHGYEYEQFSDAWAKYLDANRYSATNRRNPPKITDGKPLLKNSGSGSHLPGSPQESAICSGLAVQGEDFEAPHGQETFGGPDPEEMEIPV